MDLPGIIRGQPHGVFIRKHGRVFQARRAKHEAAIERDVLQIVPAVVDHVARWLGHQIHFEKMLRTWSAACL